MGSMVPDSCPSRMECGMAVRPTVKVSVKARPASTKGMNERAPAQPDGSELRADPINEMSRTKPTTAAKCQTKANR